MSQDYINELKELKSLVDQGIITQENFEQKKEELLFGQSKSQSKTKEKNTEEKPQKETSNFNLKLNYKMVFNIIFIISSIALMFFLCFSKVGDYLYLGSKYPTVTYIISPLKVSDVRFTFSLLALIFNSINIVAIAISIFINNKYIEISKHFIIFISAALLLISFIFNITYRKSYLHTCSLLGIIFTSIVILCLFVSIIYNIKKYFSSKKQ